MKRWSPLGDVAALGCSALCLAHCAIVPLGVIFIPSTIAVAVNDEMFHQLIIFFTVPISLVALTLGCTSHKRLSVFLMGCCGLAMLAFAGFFGHTAVGEFGEKLLTILATCTIGFSHLMNYRLCQRARCECLV